MVIYLFVVLGHSKILGTNLNAKNSEFLIISAECTLIHAITSVGQSVRSEKNLSEISKNSVRFFLGTVFCHTK